MVSVFFDVNRASGDIYGINDISPRFLETVKLLKMKSIQVIASLLIIPMLCITIIMIIPPIIIFIIAQKYIVEGTSGSIK